MDTISRAGNFTKITPRIENDCIYGYGAGNVLTEMYGIPTIGYGPGSELVAQGSDDYVTMYNLKEAFYGTVVIAHRITGVPSVNKVESC
jgi:hypothetical protein